VDKEKIAILLEDAWTEHGDKLYGYVFSVIHSSSDSEDVLQSVFLRLAGALEDDREINSLRPYLFTIARNEALRFIEKSKKLPEPMDLSLRDPAIPAPQQAIDDEVYVLHRLSQLPPEQKESVMLKLFGNLTFREAAEIVGVSLKTIASRYRYGLLKLKELLLTE
jgi:RNA polymerase sigma-70 factor (ECF subfamily)